MHPDAPLRRLLKSSSFEHIHQGLDEVTPRQATALLDGVTVEKGALVLNRTFESGLRALPWRTYTVLHLLQKIRSPLLKAITTLSLCWPSPEAAPLDLAPLSALPDLSHLRLRNATGVHTLPRLRLIALRLEGTQISCADALKTGAVAIDLAGQTLTSLPEELVALTLRGCTGLTDFQPHAGLKQLTLLSCPDLSGLALPASLEMLVVRGCAALTALTLTPMPSLRILELPGVSLTGSTRSRQLQRLVCGPLADLDVLCSPALEHAEVGSIDTADLSMLADSSSLRQLHISEAPRLTNLSGITGCTALTSLRLCGTPLTSTAPLASLHSLSALSLRRSRLLTALEGLGSLPELTDLDLTGSALETLDGLAGSPSLESLTLTRCTGLDHIFAVRDITTLRLLLLPSGRGQWSARYDGAELAALRERLRADAKRAAAMATGAPMVVRLRGLLMHEDIHHQRQALEVVRSFGPSFTAEILTGCRLTEDGAVHIPFGAVSESLLVAMLDAGMLPDRSQRLIIRADRLASLHFIEKLPRLTHLTLTHCIHLTTLAGLQHATNLAELVLEDCPVLTDISALRGLRGLRRLVITDPNRAGSAFAPIDTAMLSDALTPLSWLEVLKLDRCSPLPLSLLARLPRLRTLKAPALSPGQGFARLGSLTSLEDIEVLECRELEDISALKTMPRLRRLVLGSSDRLQDLHPLSTLTALTEVVLGGRALSDLSPLARITSLTVLGLSELAGVKDIAPIGALPHLRALVLSGAQDVKELRTLRGLVTLEELGLQAMACLETLDGLSELTTLRRLELVGCPRLCCADALIDLAALDELKIDKSSAIHGVLEPLQRVTPRRIWSRRNALYSQLQHRSRLASSRLKQALASGSVAEVDAVLDALESLCSERLASAVLAELQKQAGQEESQTPLPLAQHAIARLTTLFQ